MQVTMGKGGLVSAGCVFMLYDRVHIFSYCLSILIFMLMTFSRAKICLYFSKLN